MEKLELKIKIEDEIAHLEEYLRTFYCSLIADSKMLVDTIFRQITSNLNVKKIETLSVVIRESRRDFSRRIQMLLSHNTDGEFLHIKIIILCEDVTFAINDILLIERYPIDPVEDVIEDDDLFEEEKENEI